MNDLISSSEIEKKISSIISPTIETLGYELVRVRLVPGETSTLQIMADRRSGEIDVEDCSIISRDISVLLDVEDPINDAYILEVSSPGIDRPLTRLKDFNNWQGYEVKLETYELINGQRRFKGEIYNIEKDNITLANNGKFTELSFKLISEAKLILTDNLIKDVLRNRKSIKTFDLENFDQIDKNTHHEGDH
ncbi:MAG: ribosome maturation factor RimP [Paracoccaceae bacterium]